MMIRIRGRVTVHWRRPLRIEINPHGADRRGPLRMHERNLIQHPGINIFLVSKALLATNTAGMAKKPEPPKPMTWNIYKLAIKVVWLGIVEAADEAGQRTIV
jgi:hypothetical protein